MNKDYDVRIDQDGDVWIVAETYGKRIEYNKTKLDGAYEEASRQQPIRFHWGEGTRERLSTAQFSPVF